MQGFVGSGGVYYGDEAIQRRGILMLTFPTRFGSVHDWDDEAAVWGYAITDKLGVQPSAQPVVIVVPASLGDAAFGIYGAYVASLSVRVRLFI